LVISCGQNMTNNSNDLVISPKRKSTWLNALQYLVFFAGGIGIFLWVYRGQDPKGIINGLASFDYKWILISFLLALISHYIRAMRWRMMIHSIGYNPSRINTFFAVLIMYLANYALPRMGEVTRCGILKKYEKVPFTNQLGTVVAERTVDFLFLLLLLVVVAMIEWSKFLGFASEQTLDQNSWMVKIFTSGLIWVALGLGVTVLILFFVFRKQLLKNPFVSKMAGFANKFVDGLRSVLKLKNPWLFLVYTFAIYALYFGMTYSVMLAFGPTKDLGVMAGLAVLTLGSVGMVVPVQGGIGSYHFFSIETLLLYGVMREDATILAFVLHGSMSLFLIVIGVFALALLPWVNRSVKS